MAQFLDFIFPFGERIVSKDVHFSALRVNNRFSDANCAAEVPEIGRSGKQFEMCLNLRSVEQAIGTPEWPWSIRQTAVYHSFDVVSGRTVWIVVKGNTLIRERVQNALTTSKRGGEGNQTFGSLENSFCASLEVLLIICDWAREQWRSYINFLDDQFQITTGTALHTSVDQPPPLSPTEAKPLARAETTPNLLRSRRTSSWPGIPQGKQARRVMTSGETWLNARPANESHELPVVINNKEELGRDGDFSFSKLQSIQNLLEKVDETRLILAMNMNVMRELSEYHENLRSLPHWSENFKSETYDGVQHFCRTVLEAASDMEMQRSRLENLHNNIADRKELVSSAPMMTGWHQCH